MQTSWVQGNQLKVKVINSWVWKRGKSNGQGELHCEGRASSQK